MINIHDFSDPYSPPLDEMDLEIALEHCREALDLFFDNKFTEAKSVMEPWYVIFVSISQDSVYKIIYAFLIAGGKPATIMP